MNLAVVLKLPTLFVYEDNGYGEHTGTSYAVGSNDITGRCAGFGMTAKKCDGADFFAVYETAGELIAQLRAGDGPASLECSITRFYGHYEGDPQKYRAKDEVANFRETMDCLKNFRDRVAAEGSVDLAKLDVVDAEVAQLIDTAVEQAQASPAPGPAEVLTDVYISY